MMDAPPTHEDYEPAFYEAVGRFVVAFAMAEVGIDGAGAVIFHGYGGKTLRKRLPVNVSAKLEYLREAAERLDKVRPFSFALLNAIELLQDLAEKRNYIIHGIHGVTDSDEAVFGKPVVTKDNVYMSHHPATTETILAYRQATLFAASNMIGLVLRMSDGLR
jgi:hypothetical protein